MFVLLFLVCIGGLTLSLRGSAVANPKLTYQIGANDSVVSVRSIRRNTLYRDGLLYINMSELASYCEFTTTGTVREIRFISKTETNDNVRFILGTPIAYVNGYQVRLNGAVIYEDDAVLVPSDFITHYVSGLDVSVDEKTGKVILSRTVDANYEAPVSIRDNAGDVHYEQIVFTLQQQQPCERISESSVLYQNPSVQTAQTGTDDPASP